jgi:uncharacterized protein (DUF2147 family)
MKKLTFVFLFLANLAFGQDITKGLWYNEGKEAKIQFYEEEGRLFGKITWLKSPKIDGKDKTDTANENPKFRNRPLVGLVILKNFKKDGKNWKDGEIYDPKSGKTYSSTIKWAGENNLNIRGFIGVALVGKTTKFTRAE